MSLDYKIFKILNITIVLAIASFFLFFNLGHYDLWDDEADTAFYAQSVWERGDAYAVRGKHFIAQIWELDVSFRNRYMPPIQFYLAAPFVGLNPTSSFWARFPFACCGLITIALVLFWLHKANASRRLWILMSMGLLGNVSLFLYFRQCRYFAPTILFATLLVYFYTFRKNTIKNSLLIILSALLLFHSNYLCAVAIYVCIVCDYFFWGRHSNPLNKKIVLFIISLILLCVNWSITQYFERINVRFHKGFHVLFQNPDQYQYIIFILKKRLFLFLWNLRELNTYEFGAGLILLLAPCLYFKTKNKHLLRCLVAIIIYCFVIAILSPQIYNEIQHPLAIARYLIPLILLCIFTVVFCIDLLLPRSRAWVFVIAILVFGTNILNGGTSIREEVSFITDQKMFRSTVIAYVKELLKPLPQSTRVVSQWVNENLPPETSIWVNPGYQTTPLMFHAPQMRYVWLINWEDDLRLRWLKDSQKPRFFKLTSPEYMIAYGHHKFETLSRIKELNQKGIYYEQIKQIDVFWIDLTRPELYWRSFDALERFSRGFQSIYIYKRILQ